MHRQHGLTENRGINEAAMTNAGPVRSHRFGNRFAELDVYDRSPAFLRRLGSAGGPLFGGSDPDDDAELPAGIAFFGQFVDHDVTFDPTSAIDRRNDPAALRNFRTPALDLDSVYGTGPEVSPELYDGRDPDGAKLLTGTDGDPVPGNEDAPRVARYGATDLQRNEQGVAILPDPRNDENVVISQLQLAFVKFHNRVVDYVRSGPGHGLVRAGEDYFDAAERLTRWHYQWLVTELFLPAICDGSVLDDIEATGRQYFLLGDRIAIPVEFAGAAYRYGHSQIRDTYTVNSETTDVEFFPGPSVETLVDLFADADPDNPPDVSAMADAESGAEMGGQSLAGGGPVPNELLVDWGHFFDCGDGTTPQPARKIDPQLPPALFLLPFVPEGEEQSLAARNLLRGVALGLPGGQAVAEAMDITPLSNAELPLTDEQHFRSYLRSQCRGADEDAPLWLYVLAEAEAQQDGHSLGAVGSRIVAEVLLGMIDADPDAYRNVDPGWRPALPRPVSSPELDDPHTSTAPYGFGDFLQFATGPVPDGLEIAAVDADGSGGAPAPDTVDEATGGEAVVLEHTGAGPLSLAHHAIDFEDDQTNEFGDITLSPGESLVVYTGSDDLESEDYRVLTLGYSQPVIDNTGESVTVTTPANEVSAFARFEP
ncbi:hypothetical protein EGH22_05405 [Halomicroarcula sp. F28]|uniref:peroxidase family protein n=1 Tax=Haloarcula salinisoli TaxID=2487746 RepID=UPI001C73DAC9|nr:peroxidase family protein [Halomicroarcula salinisoli]MBX0285752.1 hypothetical protein [Halomicroarcula salinisoli]